MVGLKKIWSCATANFKKWKVTPRIYCVFIVVAIFIYQSFYGFNILAKELDLNITPWLFPFFLGNPTMFFIYGGLTILLFCNAPFRDASSFFMIIRCGRFYWILGQLLYVILASLVYTLVTFGLSVAIILPNLEFSLDWGELLYTLAGNPALIETYDITLSSVPSYEMLQLLTPLQAVAIAFVMYWLVAIFLGITILSFNICFMKTSGLVVSAILVCIAYFAPYLGYLTIGRTIYFFSPVTWSSISYLDLTGNNEIPSPYFAAILLIGLCILLSLLAINQFTRKDLDVDKEVF